MNHSNNNSFSALRGANRGGSGTPGAHLWNFATPSPHPGRQQVHLSRSEQQRPEVDCSRIFDQPAAAHHHHLSNLERRMQRQIFEDQPQVCSSHEEMQSSYLMGRSSARPSLPSACHAAQGRSVSNAWGGYVPYAPYVPSDIPVYVPPPPLPNAGGGKQVNKRHPMILDSGCGPSSVLMPCMKPAFTPYGDPTVIDIRTANSVDAVTCVRGDIRLVTQGVSGRQVSLNLPNSLVSEGFSQNLICLRALILDGWKVEWFADYALLHNPERTDAVRLDCLDGMYIFPAMNARADNLPFRPARIPSAKSSTSPEVKPPAAMGGRSEQDQGPATRSSSRIKFDSPEPAAPTAMPMVWQQQRAQEEAICDEARNPLTPRTGELPRSSPRTRSMPLDADKEDVSSASPAAKGPATRPSTSSDASPPASSSRSPLTAEEWNVIKACQPPASTSTPREEKSTCAPLSAEDFDTIKASQPTPPTSPVESRYPPRVRSKPDFLHNEDAPVLDGEGELSRPDPVKEKMSAGPGRPPKTKKKMPSLQDATDSDPEGQDWEWQEVRGRAERTMPTPQEGKAMMRKAAAESRATSTPSSPSPPATSTSAPAATSTSEPYPRLTMPAKTGSRAEMHGVDEPANITEHLDRIDALHLDHHHAGQARLALIIKGMLPSENPPPLNMLHKWGFLPKVRILHSW